MRESSTDTPDDEGIDSRIADRLQALRHERAWSLDTLAQLSGVSRATLSRLEAGETSPTARVLGRLCGAYGIAMSRLVAMVEDDHQPLVRRNAQAIWEDPETGFRRRGVSPPARSLAGEVIEGTLPGGAAIDYPVPPRRGLEHHLVLLEGQMSVHLDGALHTLEAGDCLRYRLDGPSAFRTPAKTGARYVLFMV